MELAYSLRVVSLYSHDSGLGHAFFVARIQLPARKDDYQGRFGFAVCAHALVSVSSTAASKHRPVQLDRPQMGQQFQYVMRLVFMVVGCGSSRK